MTVASPSPTADPRDLIEAALDDLIEVESTCSVLMSLSMRRPSDSQAIEIDAHALCILSARLHNCAKAAQARLQPVSAFIYEAKRA